MAEPLNLFILTGAGISAESGLSTFRDADGLWTQNDLAKLATPEGFAENPGRVRDFYSARRKVLEIAAPNKAHLALARLEREMTARGGSVFLCTQNVDDLHEKAGSQRVFHMHGELTVTRCTLRAGRWTDRGLLSAQRSALPAVSPRCARTSCGSARVPYRMDEIYERACRSRPVRLDRHLGRGLSRRRLRAEPPASLAPPTLELNLERSAGSSWFEETRLGPASGEGPAVGGRGAGGRSALLERRP